MKIGCINGDILFNYLAKLIDFPFLKQISLSLTPFSFVILPHSSHPKRSKPGKVPHLLGPEWSGTALLSERLGSGCSHSRPSTLRINHTSGIQISPQLPRTQFRHKASGNSSQAENSRNLSLKIQIFVPLVQGECSGTTFSQKHFNKYRCCSLFCDVILNQSVLVYLELPILIPVYNFYIRQHGIVILLIRKCRPTIKYSVMLFNICKSSDPDLPSKNPVHNFHSALDSANTSTSICPVHSQQ